MFVMDGLIRRTIMGLIGPAGDAKVEVSGGNIKIEDVHFDEKVLEDALFPPTTADLPLVRLGMVYVKKLAITIPWGKFSTGFVDVELDGLAINLVRRKSADETLEHLRARKEECVAALMEELIGKVSAMEKEGKRGKKAEASAGKEEKDDDDGGGGPLASMVRGIIRQVLQSFRPIIRITNLHIRYEDLKENAVVPMALGVTVGHLIVQHPDSPYSMIDEDPNMKPVTDVQCLEVSMAGVGVYLHTESMGVTSVVGAGSGSGDSGGGDGAGGATTKKVSPLKRLLGLGPSEEEARRKAAATGGGEDLRTVEAMWKVLEDLLLGRGTYGPQQWLVGPIAMSGKIHVNVGIFIKAPTRWDCGYAFVVDLRIPAINVRISDKQATTLIRAAAGLQMMPARYLYKMLMPKRKHIRGAKRPALSPRLRWRMAILAVLHSNLVTISPATRMHNAIRDRGQYQKVLAEALVHMRQKSATGEPELEDIKMVTTETEGKIKLGDMVEEESLGDGDHDELMHVDAITSPMQIALWRLVAWAKAKTDEQEKGAAGVKLPGNAKAKSSKKGAMSPDEVMAASSEMGTADGDEDAEEGANPFAGAPEDFELAVVDLRIGELTAALLLDDSAKDGLAASAAPFVPPPPTSVTTTREVQNADGSETTVTTIEVTRPVVDNAPTTIVVEAAVRSIGARARVVPAKGTMLHAAVGQITVEHAVGRGHIEHTRLVCLHGNTEWDDVILGAPLPATEVPIGSSGLFGFGGGAQPEAAAAIDDGGAGAGIVAPEGAEAELAPPAIFAIVSLPPDPAEGDGATEDGGPTGLTSAEAIIQRIELVLAPHQFETLWRGFCIPLDAAFNCMPGPCIDRLTIGALREAAAGMLVKPWWGVDGILPAIVDGVGGAVPGLLGLVVKVEIREGIQIHMLAEPERAKTTRETFPVGSVELPPLSVSLGGAYEGEDQRVRITLDLIGDFVLSKPKAAPEFKPDDDDDDERPDTSTLMARLLVEEAAMRTELKELQARHDAELLEREQAAAAVALEGKFAAVADGAEEAKRPRRSIFRRRSRAQAAGGGETGEVPVDMSVVALIDGEELLQS